MPSDTYQTVTDQIIAMLDAGVVPWRSPILGSGPAGHPRNVITGRRYRGINVFLLAFTAYTNGYASAGWLTFNQARAAGGTVRRGEKSSVVVFWKQFQTTDRKTGEATTVPMMRTFNLFSVDQCDGVSDPEVVPPPASVELRPIERASAIVDAFEGKPAIEVGGTRAFYRPATDTVTMPGSARFARSEDYFSVLYHEIAHSTGHPNRLNRETIATPQPFGSADYGREELVAEMAASFICAAAGIVPATIDNQAAYIGGWLRTIRSDKRLVISAAGAAQRAAEWVMNVRPSLATPAGDATD
jgi:antirestriction protein ArdC